MESSQLSALVKDIERCISSLGLMYRIFYREKSIDSFLKKINRTPGKYSNEKKVQDLIGIRIALYFVDDIDIVRNALEKKFDFIAKDSQIDTPAIETFSAVRYNLIFKLPEYYNPKFEIEPEYHKIIDNTFELQIRTILSEGWHEVDHDLRFKCKEDWFELEKENRAFNGVYATLETSEWTLLKLFEDLAYIHYKKSNIKAMINNKFRLRFKPSKLDDDILKYLIDKPNLIKKIYRYERSKLLFNLSIRPFIPINISNLIFIMNLESLNDEGIFSIMPPTLEMWWESAN
ncbi:RelA/SpoT domain-containing protein [Dickeya undicola]|uniref:RelA/SpoT domain-containing protein n=1 Tax=Dickeya undicola TaxID=1577887 RepID=A0A3N0FX73_9GAMM|nr:RelA/SpoT domain-containing protein [Dickeya undicola]RNM04652.1 hypothetical protein EF878_14650 [Dickeya undicola]